MRNGGAEVLCPRRRQYRKCACPDRKHDLAATNHCSQSTLLTNEADVGRGADPLRSTAAQTLANDGSHRLSPRDLDEAGAIEHRLRAEPHEVVDATPRLVEGIRFE